VVEIEWDIPEEDHWLCPENIQLALEACCTNTKFKVKKVEVIPMLTRFSSVDELVKALEDSKFPLVGIPYTWTFGGLIRIDVNKPNVLIIKDKEYPVVVNVVEKCMVVIAIPGA
jgi:hypothetical protein